MQRRSACKAPSDLDLYQALRKAIMLYCVNEDKRYRYLADYYAEQLYRRGRIDMCTPALMERYHSERKGEPHENRKHSVR